MKYEAHSATIKSRLIDDDDDQQVEGGEWKLWMLPEEGFEFFWRNQPVFDADFKTAYSV